MTKINKIVLTTEQNEQLISILKSRFEQNMKRHVGITWADVQAKLAVNSDKLCSVNEMEISGGEPDVIQFDKSSNEFIFIDCSAESPKGRRSICYDPQALESRKEHKPANSAVGMANDMGIEIISEDEYRWLQTFGNFDLKTSSWVKTPTEIRKLGGAIFCDKRYEHVFMYHNGAESYYASRGFRGLLRV